MREKKGPGLTGADIRRSLRERKSGQFVDFWHIADGVLRTYKTSLGEKVNLAVILQGAVDWASGQNPTGIFSEAIGRFNFLPGEIGRVRKSIKASSDLYRRISRLFSEETRDEVGDDKVGLAALNQEFAAVYVLAGQGLHFGADPHVENARDFANVMAVLIRLNTHEGNELGRIVAGAKAQAVFFSVLKAGDFWVYAPDPKNREEVRNLDLNGVDLIAHDRQEDCFFCFDVKSVGVDRWREEDFMFERVSQPDSTCDFVVETVREKLIWASGDPILTDRERMIACKVYIASWIGDNFGQTTQRNKDEIIQRLRTFAYGKRG